MELTQQLVAVSVRAPFLDLPGTGKVFHRIQPGLWPVLLTEELGSFKRELPWMNGRKWFGIRPKVQWWKDDER